MHHLVRRAARPRFVMPTLLPTLLATLVGAILCGPATASVYVGNPALTTTIAGGQGLVYTSLTLDAAVPRADGCAPAALNGGAPVELLGDEVALPHTTCAVGMETGGALTITGTGPNGSSFELELAVDDVVLALAEEVVFVPGESSVALILELGEANWVTATALGLQANQHVVIDAQSPLHDDLVAAIEQDSHLFLDSDGDGVVDSSERSAGPLD